MKNKNQPWHASPPSLGVSVALIALGLALTNALLSGIAQALVMAVLVIGLVLCAARLGASARTKRK